MAEILPCSKDIKLAHTIAAGQEVLRALSAEFDIDISRFNAVADLFLPKDAHGDFALWLAASFDRSGAPSFKVYLNPGARGAVHAPLLVEEMFRRLGFEGAWETAAATFLRGGTAQDDLRFISLDLARSPNARVKVYGFHHGVTVDDLVRIASAAPGADGERVAAFCRTIADGDNLGGVRAPATCLSFVAGESAPRTATVHVPVRVLSSNDAEAHARVMTAITEAGFDAAPYERALRSLATKPLDASHGVVAWAGIRTGIETRINVYLAPRVLAESAAADTPPPSVNRRTPETVVARAEMEPITAHPFLQRVARSPFDLDWLTLILENVGEAVTRDFARRLASMTARVEEDAIRSVLAKQLNEELGNGDPTQTHKILFERLISALSPWRRARADVDWVEPGRTLWRMHEDIYLHRDPYEALGAALVMEVYGKQFDVFMAQQFRRKKEALPASVLEWLTIHEEIEIEHVDECYELARYVPAGWKTRSVARGAEEIIRASRKFFDDLAVMADMSQRLSA